MSQDDKVISLDERRKGRHPTEENTRDLTPQPSPENGMNEPALPGKLVWLHCPTCDTYQYTELALSGGRQHNVCGTVVEEVEIEIDVRAEITIAEFNLQRLEDLSRVLESEKKNFDEYRKRLQLVAGKKVTGYALTEANLSRLPVATISPLGLLIPEALDNPKGRFANSPGEDSEGDNAVDPPPSEE